MGALRRAARLGAAAALGYLAGTIPSADVATRLAIGGDTDLRRTGSGNPGAVNAMAVLGRGWGYGVMAADVGKGALAAGAGRLVGGGDGAHVAGTAAVVGHCFPVWNGFRGGKGVAASAGQCLATFPAYTAIDLAVAAATASSPWWRQRAVRRHRGRVDCVGRRPGFSGGGGIGPTRGVRPRPVSLPLAAAGSSAVILYRFATARPPA